jgi:NADH:ubiquinone oxidoreductase subunit D
MDGHGFNHNLYSEILQSEKLVESRQGDKGYYLEGKGGSQMYRARSREAGEQARASSGLAVEV